MKDLLTWIPRIIGLLFTGFMILFSLDAFSGDTSIAQKILGFLLHLIPAFVVGGCLLLAWKYRLLGGVLFMVLGMVFTIYFSTYRTASHFVSVSLPLFVAGILFMVSQWNVVSTLT